MENSGKRPTLTESFRGGGFCGCSVPTTHNSKTCSFWGRLQPNVGLVGVRVLLSSCILPLSLVTCLCYFFTFFYNDILRFAFHTFKEYDEQFNRNSEGECFWSSQQMDLRQERGDKTWLWPNCVYHAPMINDFFKFRPRLLNTHILPVQRNTTSVRSSIAHRHSLMHQISVEEQDPGRIMWGTNKA